jgi:hypothetical protein
MKNILLIILISLSTYSLAWDGTDNEGNSIEIGSGNLVRAGKEIEVEVNGESKTYEVESVSSGEVEVYDYESGEYKTFDMD